jgi:nucleoside-diphosphate-sugar epimerase
LFTDVNVRGAVHVLLAARDVGARVVSASSSSVYGDRQLFPLVESMAPLPRSPYAASKLAGEAFCRAFTWSMDVPTVSLRYFNVYGPGQDPASEYAAVVPRFSLACLTGSRPVVHGDGTQARDFTYVDDVIEANLLTSRAGDDAQGRAFNIGGGAEPTTVNDVLRLIADLTGISPDPIHEPPREGDVRRTEADLSLARELLGYTPAVGMTQGPHARSSTSERCLNAPAADAAALLGRTLIAQLKRATSPAPTRSFAAGHQSTGSAEPSRAGTSLARCPGNGPPDRRSGAR